MVVNARVQELAAELLEAIHSTQDNGNVKITTLGGPKVKPWMIQYLMGEITLEEIAVEDIKHEQWR